MKFINTLVSALALALLPSAAVLATQVSYDTTYDNPSGSLNSVACSNGGYGLETKGYTNFGSLPDFPYIGGSSAVAGWNSVNCGTCWSVTYQGITINVLVIDSATDGLNLSFEAMNNLTSGNAQQFGVVQADVTQVSASVCGL